MRRRCYDSTNNRYKHYGARGIKVCDRWKDPTIFIQWYDQQPHAYDILYSLDRIDNNGNYEPGNCRLATKSEQIQNSRQARLLEYNSRTWTLKELTDCYKIDYRLVWLRLKRGKSIQEALTHVR